MLGFVIPFLFPKEFGAVRDSISGWIGARINDLKNFLGLSPTPTTSPVQEPYIPPFIGGQCLVAYNTVVRAVFTYKNGTTQTFDISTSGFSGSGTRGALRGVQVVVNPNSGTPNFGQYSVAILCSDFSGIPYARNISSGLNTNIQSISASFLSITRADGQADNCGNIPNPSPQPTLPYEQGGANAANPYISNELNTVYEGLPLALPTNLLGVLAGLAGLIGNALDALDGIKKIGDAIGTIQKLLDLLLKDKERRDRANPIFKKKLIGFWREIVDDDGYVSFNQIPIGTKFAIPYAIQIVVESFPSTASRLLGTKSPDIGSDPYPLFYLQLQNNSFGIRDIIHVRSLNSFHYLDSLDRGCFYNFRQNPECNAKFRIFYELETDEVQAQ